MSIDYGLVGTWIGSIIAVTVATLGGYQQARKSGEAKVQQAQSDLVKTIEASRDAWRLRFEEEHAEFRAYRDQTHDRLNSANDALLKCTEDCAMLRVKTDITPVIAMLERITKVLDVITQRLDYPTANK